MQKQREFKNVFLLSSMTGFSIVYGPTDETFEADLIVDENKIKFVLSVSSDGLPGEVIDTFHLKNPFKDIDKIQLISEGVNTFSSHSLRNINILTDGKWSVSFWKNKNRKIRGKIRPFPTKKEIEEAKDKAQRLEMEIMTEVVKRCKVPSY